MKQFTATMMVRVTVSAKSAGEAQRKVSDTRKAIWEAAQTVKVRGVQIRSPRVLKVYLDRKVCPTVPILGEQPWLGV